MNDAGQIEAAGWNGGFLKAHVWSATKRHPRLLYVYSTTPTGILIDLPTARAWVKELTAQLVTD